MPTFKKGDKVRALVMIRSSLRVKGQEELGLEEGGDDGSDS